MKDKEQKQSLKKEALEIEKFLNDARDKLNAECPGLMPYSAKVIFVDKKGKAIT